jgi:hypothetical protein
MLLRNQLYAGIVDVPEYGVRAKRGDFEPLISEELFYQVQAVLSGRVPSTAPRQRAHPDFPLRGFVRCHSCGRGITGSWCKGRNEYYAYYHCRPGCRAVNVSKARLEGLFADQLALLHPTPGYMRLLKESVLQIWKARKATVHDAVAAAERAATAIQEKPDRLDEAFLFERSIDIETYDRHAEKLREELTLARIDRHSGQLEELDVEGILAFAERILPRASDLWVQASLDQRQRFQQLFSLCLWRAASTGAPRYRRAQRARSISPRSASRNVRCLDRSQALDGRSGPVAFTDQVPPSRPNILRHALGNCRKPVRRLSRVLY